MKNNTLRWILPVFWMGVIFYLSSIPKLEATDDPFWNLVTRKIAHLCAYAILFLLFNYCFQGKRTLVSLTLTVVYAISDELHQLFVPLREGSPVDVLIDSMGAMIGWLVAWKYRWMKIDDE